MTILLVEVLAQMNDVESVPILMHCYLKYLIPMVHSMPLDQKSLISQQAPLLLILMELMRGRDFEGKNEQLHMLLSTTYGLNSSYTKRIHVGLQATSEAVFVPLVKLTGNCADGVYFDKKSWQQFQENMGLVSEYLNGESKLKPNSISINNISVNFTSAYRARSIFLAYKENEKDTSTRTDQRTDEENCPPTKKRKTCAVAIVMQKPTFLGLKNIAKCIDAHLLHLKSVADNVNNCARYLIKEIELNLPKSYIDEDIVKLTLRGNYNDIERNVRTQITDLTFLDMYFNIVFLELILLRFIEIRHIILSNRGL
ncbi:uncharacterized protein [Temnothorax longispinosus]|uniref:uncharacterized protein n=1 Tax=Temnothorax longispinosus TaxID=300112 RepID=UPI003A998E12